RIQYYTPAGKGFPADFRCCDTGAPHVAVTVPDMAEAYEALTAAGVKFTSPPQEADAGVFVGCQTAYCYDPDGIVVELWQMPK
ncbi:MAG: VOC family protein, partial [Chloroflexi bacterium]|nr:VOC family protein [Chloroflexota bacterium]